MDASALSSAWRNDLGVAQKQLGLTDGCLSDCYLPVEQMSESVPEALVVAAPLPANHEGFIAVVK